MNDDSTTIRPDIDSSRSRLVSTTSGDVVISDSDGETQRGVTTTAYRLSVALIVLGLLIALATLLSDLWSRRTKRIAQDVARGAAAAGDTVNNEVPAYDTLAAHAEYLTIDKQNVVAGEASISKQIVAEQQLIDVPVSHDELYIDRRAVNDSALTQTAPIGIGEDILIPLTEEQLNIQKHVVVSDEIAIGKRRVEGLEHVSDTVRHEELRLDDAGTASTVIPHISDTV